MKRPPSKLMVIVSMLSLALAAPVLPALAAGSARELSSVASPVFESSLATVSSPRKTDITAEMDGVLKKILILEAAKITLGDPLLEFDCRANVLALKRAELALKISEETTAQAKAGLERSSEGFRNNSVSQVQNEAAQLAFATASLDVTDKELNRDAAALAVERCSVRAPFTGVVTGIKAGPGSYMTAGTLVLSMIETENLEVIAQLTPDEIDILGNSKTLEFISGDENFAVTIRTVEPVFDSAAGVQRVLLQLPPEADLPIGLTGVLRWQGNRFSLPGEYLVRREAEVGLLIQENGAESFFPVPGAIEGLPVLVNLPAWTKVILP